jgi:hypothetical protein
MAFSDPISKKAVLAAIAECDRLGRDAFLAKYGFGRARRYFLDHGSREYDSKAIVGVAHGFQYPAKGPLGPHDFSGGDLTVRSKLQQLGFRVRVTPKKQQARRPA